MIIIKTEQFVINLLNKKLDSAYTYHNLSHTKRVVNKVIELAELCSIDGTEKQQLILAAWLHDTGYTKGSKDHEKESAAIAKTFLLEQRQSKTDINAICNLILATEINEVPKKQLEKIIRDADCAHVGSNYFSEVSQLLRKEWELTLKKKYSEIEWLNENINFLTLKHRFYTNEALTKWNKTKSKNLSNLLLKKQKLELEN